jgi:hypothetical protein
VRLFPALGVERSSHVIDFRPPSLRLHRVRLPEEPAPRASGCGWDVGVQSWSVVTTRKTFLLKAGCFVVTTRGSRCRFSHRDMYERDMYVCVACASDFAFASDFAVVWMPETADNLSLLCSKCVE